MADHAVDADDVVLRAALARDRCKDRMRSLRPRVALIGPSVAEVVSSAGGWIFDQTMAGWDALVVARDLEGARSLEILGARCIDLDAALADIEYGPCPHTLAVSADLYRLDRRVREGVWETLTRGDTTVTMWGRDCPVELMARVSTVQYRMSCAARAFKVCALAEAVTLTPSALGEVFHTAEPSALVSVARN